MKRANSAVLIGLLVILAGWAVVRATSQESPQKANPATAQTAEGATRAAMQAGDKVHVIAFAQLDEEKPAKPNQPWPGHIIPMNRHVAAGGQLLLVNLCKDEEITVTFREPFFKEGYEFTLRPDQVERLHLLPDVKIAVGDERSVYEVRGRPYRTLPTPNLYVP